MQNEIKIIFFDGVCNLCNSSVDFIVRHEISKAFFFSSLQSEFAKEFFKLKNKDLSYESIILFESDNFHIKSDAALRISRFLKWPWKGLKWGVFLPRILRDKVYELIAKNRYRWFGQKETCRFPTNEELSYFLETAADLNRVHSDRGK